MAAVLFGRRRGAEEREHVVGDLRAGRPDLAAVDAPAALGFGRLGLGREQVGARARLTHADRRNTIRRGKCAAEIILDVLGRVFEQDRAALTVGDKMQVRRRIGNAKFFGDHVTL